MKRLGNIPYFTLLIYFVVGVIVVATELPDLHPEDQFTYLIFRMLSLVPALPLAFALRKNPFSIWANCLVGILFFLPRRHFFGMLTFMSGAFMAFWLLTFGKVKYPISPAETHLDVVVVCLIAPIISIIVHHFFTAERGLKEDALSRFSLVGKHATQIIHDIKGSISIPIIHFENVHLALDKNNLQAASDQATLGRNALLDLSRRVFDLNQMANLTTTDSEHTSLHEVISATYHLLQTQLKEINVTISGDHKITADRGLLISTFMNLFVNSIENFKKNLSTDPQIRIEITDGAIVFMDNGGGFSEKILESLKSGIPITTKEAGTGIGLFMIRENLKMIGAKVHFKNTNQYAQVMIELKK